MKKSFAIYKKKIYEPVNGKIQTRIEDVDVRVMAVAEGYAMVRRKGAMPFCVSEKNLVMGGQSK